MSPRRHASAAWTVVASLLWLARCAAAGPVVYTEQERFVTAHLREFYQVGDPDVDPPEQVDSSETRSAPDFAPFDEALVIKVVPPPNQPRPEPSGEVDLSQRSELTDAGVSFSGVVSGHNGTEAGSYDASTRLDVKFLLDESRDYDLSFSVTRFHAAGGQTRLFLRDEDDGSMIFDEFFNNQLDDTVTGTRTGSLAPGRYRLLFAHTVGGEGSDGNYDVSFDLAAAPTPSPIPLPAPFLPALGTLVGVWLVQARRGGPNRGGGSGRNDCGPA